MSNSREHNALQLAARAYLAASQVPGHTDVVKAGYRALAEEALVMHLENSPQQETLTLEALEDAFQQECGDADVWYEALVNDERSWIQDGFDPEVEFAKKYDAEPTATKSPVIPQRVARVLILDLVLILSFVAIGLFVVMRISIPSRLDKREASAVDQECGD